MLLEFAAFEFLFEELVHWLHVVEALLEEEAVDESTLPKLERDELGKIKPEAAYRYQKKTVGKEQEESRKSIIWGTYEALQLLLQSQCYQTRP